jgi:signal transduction histidine kinase
METSEWKEIKELFDFATDLVHKASFEKLDRISSIIVEKAAKITKADRTCLLLLKQNELYIENGFPFESGQHGFGEKITPKIGEKFLKGVIDSRTALYVSKPEEDIRTAYMRGMIREHKISSILFVPLYKENEDFGVIVFDFKNGNYQSVKIRFVASAITKSLSSLKEREKEEERIKRNERVCALGENSLRVAHSLRNNLTVIGGLARREVKLLSAEPEKMDLDKAKETAKNIAENVVKTEKIVGDILRFSKIPEIRPRFFNLNEFLKREINDFIRSDVYPDIKFSQRLDKKLGGLEISFDANLLAVCVADIVRNAYEAEAKRIWVRTTANLKHGVVSIFIANDGEKIDTAMTEEIFSPFMTTKPDGTGLGLANVKNIIIAHGGDVSVMSNNTTEFKIELPLRTKNMGP